MRKVLLLIASLAAACGGGGSSSAPSTTPPSTTPPATTPPGTTPPGTTPPSSSACIGKTFLDGLGKTRLMTGATFGAPATAKAAKWDVSYIYLAGGLQNGATPCTVCDASCGSAWWGCYDTPPGQYAKNHIAASKANGQIPMFTYDEILQASGATEGAGEVRAMNDPAFASKILGDLRFLFQTIGTETVLVHVEPDFFGFAQELVNQDPAQIPVQVQQFSDCSGQPNTLTGFDRCIIAMARKYSPNVRIGLHASIFGSGIDVSLNKSASVDPTVEGTKVGNFMKAAGADAGDFVVMDASDRDAAYYDLVVGVPHDWDATNATLPNFHQDFAWAKAVAEAVSLPMIYWQVPVGDPNGTNTTNSWKDNRVDYFYAHTDELAAAHVAAMLFGAGDASTQTTLESDHGYLTAKEQAYAAGAGQSLCQ